MEAHLRKRHHTEGVLDVGAPIKPILDIGFALGRIAAVTAIDHHEGFTAAGFRAKIRPAGSSPP